MLTFFKFSGLPKEEQMYILFEKGKRIAQRSRNDINILLYALNNFYVEFGVATIKDEVHITITAHTSYEHLNYRNEEFEDREVA